MDIGKETTVYVKALSDGQWFGGWAPVRARLEWRSADERAALFTLTEEELDADDEYEFYEAGSLVLGVWEEGEYRVRTGMAV